MILAAAAIGVAGCRWAGVDWHPRDLAAAAAGSLLTAEVAVLLVLRQRHAATVAVAQAALLALTAHLLLSVALAAALIFSGRVSGSFLWWALVTYWATLIGVCAVLVRSVRTAARCNLARGVAPAVTPGVPTAAAMPGASDDRH